jgi:hypothetical protein
MWLIHHSEALFRWTAASLAILDFAGFLVIVRGDCVPGEAERFSDLFMKDFFFLLAAYVARSVVLNLSGI